jgi:hypothetical protein
MTRKRFFILRLTLFSFLQMLHNMHNCTIDNVFECVKEENLYFRGSRRLWGGEGVVASS